MKTVKLLTMAFRNFKGVESLDISFDSQTRIYGNNATGKTTLVDGFTFLLFGKDSSGKKDFSIKPFDAENNVIHHLDSEVSGSFDVNGEVITLKRVFREKWVTTRGEKESKLTGHETIFFWNDVPMKAGEYQKRVDEIILEETFKMISSPFYFNNLKWQDRRNILTTIAGNVDDKEIAASRLDFSALFEGLGSKTIDDLKKELAAKKKKLKDELKLIPARIDEVVRSTPEAKDWANIENEIEIVTKNIKIVDEQLQDKSKVSQDFYTKKQANQKVIDGLKTKVSNIEYEGSQAFRKQMNTKADAIQTAKDAIAKINNKVKEDAEEIKRLEGRINSYATEQQQLRTKWTDINTKEFPGIGEGLKKCPTCAQELPTATIESKRAEMERNFNDDKKKRLEEIEATGKGITPIVEQLTGKIKVLQDLDYKAQIKQHEDVIKEWEANPLESVQAILSGNIDYASYKKQLEEFEAAPALVEPVIDNSELNKKKQELNESLDLLKKDLTLKSQIEQGNQRKSELMSQEKSYSSELAELEQTEFTIEQFTRAKVDMLEGKINVLFNGAVKFRMFDEQLNGGLIECCDTIINGVPWNDANNAAKINAGIAIINVLTNHFGQIAPIWIDNAESITAIGDTDSQRIELYVSKDHKTLEVA